VFTGRRLDRVMRHGDDARYLRLIRSGPCGMIDRRSSVRRDHDPLSRSVGCRDGSVFRIGPRACRPTRGPGHVPGADRPQRGAVGRGGAPDSPPITITSTMPRGAKVTKACVIPARNTESLPGRGGGFGTSVSSSWDEIAARRSRACEAEVQASRNDGVQTQGQPSLVLASVSGGALHGKKGGAQVAWEGVSGPVLIPGASCSCFDGRRRRCVRAIRWPPASTRVAGEIRVRPASTWSGFDRCREEWSRPE